ncbi:MAG: hypothetical protein M1817_005890 [Caeruleum heppii]|nr:MAG: hypothetical protein M1817_005890 [Caeruleum heppii]
MASLADYQPNLWSQDQRRNMDCFADRSAFSGTFSDSDQLQSDETHPDFQMHAHFTQHYTSDASTSYDAYTPVASSAPFDTTYDAPQYVVQGLLGDLKQTPRRGSPSSFVPPTFEHTSSTLSSASGASIQSAASSAIGSPPSEATQLLNAAGPWQNVSQGLGIDPCIVTTDNFGPDTFNTAVTEQDYMLAETKVSAGYVGKSQDVPSSEHAASWSSALSSSIPAISSAPIFSPCLALPTTGPYTSDTTIETILEEVNNRINSSSHTSAPVSVNAGPAETGQSVGWERPVAVALADDSVFKSPKTPASATSAFSSRSFSATTGRKMPSPSVTPPARKRSPCSDQPRAKVPRTAFYEVDRNRNRSFEAPFFTQSSDPSLIQAFQPSPCYSTAALASNAAASLAQPPVAHSPSPTPSSTSTSRQRPGSAHIKHGSHSPYLHTMSYQPYPTHVSGRRPSISSNHSRYSSYGSQGSFRSDSQELDDDAKDKGRCPNPDCGRVFKDLKAHMLTHQSERPEKCPIVTCEYNQKGFARKYDKQRHTLTHYKGTMVCGFCPGSGSPAEKSFNRADVFKRHLTSVHGVEQTPPNSRKKPSAMANAAISKFAGYPRDATGKCSTCSSTFSNAQDLYEHLDECVLRVVQQEDPSEAINARHLASLHNDEALKQTFRAHYFPPDADYAAPGLQSLEGSVEAYEAGDDEIQQAGTHRVSPHPREGKSPVGGGKSDHRVTKRSATRNVGLTRSKGGVPLVGTSRRKRKDFPVSWGCDPEKIKMKKRVLCVYDGNKRLVKDDMMLDNTFEVRMDMGNGSYVTDLDVETLKRAEAFHNASEEEKGPWDTSGSVELDINELMS